MGYTQRHTHALPREVLQINAGLFVFRKILGSIVPNDFEWSVRFEAGLVAVYWVYIGDGKLVYQQEQTAKTIADLVDLLECVNWSAERAEARKMGVAS